MAREERYGDSRRGDKHTWYALAALLLLPWPVWSTDLPLFSIQRSKNANEVQYSLQVDDRCRLASATPVRAVWKLLAVSPNKTASLSVSLSWPMGSRSGTWRIMWCRLSEGPGTEAHRRQVTGPPQSGTSAAQAQTDIQGQRALLERLYVRTEEGWLKPEVLYVDVFGPHGCPGHHRAGTTDA